MFCKEETTLQQQLKIQQLPVNYKTLEEFELFQCNDLKGFSFVTDLQERLLEDRHDSPYLGVYYGDRLAGRMYVEKRYGNANEENPVLWIGSIEVLPEFRFRGLGSTFIDFLKQFQLPIQTKPLNFSTHFWLKMNFYYDKTTQCFYWKPEYEPSSTSDSLVC